MKHRQHVLLQCQALTNYESNYDDGQRWCWTMMTVVVAAVRRQQQQQQQWINDDDDDNDDDVHSSNNYRWSGSGSSLWWPFPRGFLLQTTTHKGRWWWYDDVCGGLLQTNQADTSNSMTSSGVHCSQPTQHQPKTVPVTFSLLPAIAILSLFGRTLWCSG